MAKIKCIIIKQVVSSIVDILLNLSLVVLTWQAVAIVPNMLADLTFQTILVYLDTGIEIFSQMLCSATNLISHHTGKKSCYMYKILQPCRCPTCWLCRTMPRS